jgi:hypothetical protein
MAHQEMIAHPEFEPGLVGCPPSEVFSSQSAITFSNCNKECALNKFNLFK